MSELVTHLDVDYTHSIDDEIASINGLKALFEKCDDNGYGIAVDAYVASQLNVNKGASEQEVLLTHNVSVPSAEKKEPIRKTEHLLTRLGHQAAKMLHITANLYNQENTRLQ